LKYTIATIALFTLAIGMSYAYAYQENVDLPRSDYTEKDCFAILFSGQNIWKFSCDWWFEETNSVRTNETGVIIQYDDTIGDPVETFLREIKLYFDETITAKETTEDDSITATVEQPDPFVELDPDVRKALNKLGICQFGEGVWAGIVANYTREVPDELPIFTSGLDKRVILGKLAKNFEECRGMNEYPWLSAAYENRYLADLLGLDYFGRSQTNFGLDESRNYEEQRTASAEDIQKEQDRVTYPDWYRNPYEELTGINRGNPEPIVLDTKAYNEYLSVLAASVQTGADLQRTYAKALDAMCDVYMPQYEYMIGSDRFPAWMDHCLD